MKELAEEAKLVHSVQPVYVWVCVYVCMRALHFTVALLLRGLGYFIVTLLVPSTSSIRLSVRLIFLFPFVGTPGNRDTRLDVRLTT